MRNETLGLSLGTFYAGGPSLSLSTRLANMIGTAFSSESEENEYSVKNNLLHISRIEEDVVLNNQVKNLLPGETFIVTSLPLKDAKLVFSMEYLIFEIRLDQ